MVDIDTFYQAMDGKKASYECLTSLGMSFGPTRTPWGPSARFSSRKQSWCALFVFVQNAYVQGPTPNPVHICGALLIVQPLDEVYA